jgi:orotidine-5'-phosphate decarboxylase
MRRNELAVQISKKNSYLCIGLDSDYDKIPAHSKSGKDPVFEFNKQIIDSTKDFCVSYKINTAFYESRGIKGWESLERTLEYIPKDIFTIADAKRGDIGNTGAHYAKTFFETFNFDAVTVAPYMGEDSIRPFLEYDGKWTIILALTSNPGANDFQFLEADGKPLYRHVLEKTSKWGTPENIMYVAGATRAEGIQEIRKIIPEHFLLVPGVGAQGGDLNKISEYGLTEDCGLLVNSSRNIIFADSSEKFAEVAARNAKEMAQQMSGLLTVNSNH